MPTTNTESNVALVQRMYACFDAGDMDTIRKEVFAPDIVWHLPGRHPLSGTKHGAEEVIAFFLQLRRANIQVRIDPKTDPRTGVYPFGEETAVEVHRGQGTTTLQDATGQKTEVKLDALNCTHYRVRNGRIADVQVYISDQYSVDQFFSAVYQLKPIPDRLA